ncbi:NYN domain-containing protein [Bradyrhizobium acaciae]|uniref:NYN domain-containing protein n=1 Tax=Bradyrhizobium acaciae TaxID=2683706 RepID=UPI001E3DCE0C|nr:NYN domain-containing protein [Bradyrhizobium acaciae]MCC8977573.1 NYN domain-containing protein [Bradyrhizobium acaciae]
MAKVHVFWDNSNIYIGAQAVLQKLGRRTTGARIDFENLLKLAIGGRQLARGHCVGSVPPEVWAVWLQLAKKTGIKPELFERGAASGKEQAVDQALQVQMLRAAIDETQPQVAVLLTGDGRGYADGVGFHADLQRLYNKGWAIEVLSWDDTCAKALKTWAAQVGCFIRLDDYAECIVFEQGVTNVKPLNMRRRPTAKMPAASSAAATPNKST